jgi:hypothetical protein
MDQEKYERRLKLLKSGKEEDSTQPLTGRKKFIRENIGVSRATVLFWVLFSWFP